MAGSQIVRDGTRTVRKIGLKPEQIRITMLGHDAVIRVDIGENEFEAMVPTSTLHPAPSRGEGYKFVPAEQIGRVGDKLIIVLPPSNDGTPIWHVREEDLEKVLIE